jgi:hypothetical protein
MFTGTTSHSGALVTTILVLTGAAILRGGAAAADSNQDDQFLALLDEEGIPAVENVASLIDTAHKVCRTLDAGMPADGLVDVMVNDAYGIDPTLGRYPRGRLVRTEARFITAAVEAYCPYDQRKIASIMANPAPGSNESTHRVRLSHLLDDGVFASDRYGGNRSDCDTHGPVLASLIGAVPSGEVTQPDPPQIPAPPPPAAQIRTPQRPVAAPPPPKQPPPPPQQAEPPAAGPQPGDAAGSGGGGSTGAGGNGGGSTGGGGNGSGSTGGNGDGGPAEPPPALPMPPGFVRLAP